VDFSLPDAAAFRLRAAALFPGVLACLTIGMAATFLSDHYGAPAVLMALILGLAFGFLYRETRCSQGISFTTSPILRLGVALLGARITLNQALALGWRPVILVVAGVVLTIALGLLVARLLGRDWTMGMLTGGSVAICGASAAMALVAILPPGKDGHRDRDLAFTVVSVTAMGTMAMVFYPLLGTWLGFDSTHMGVFLGTTIHDVAQVVGAGYSQSEAVGDTATLVKLLRVAMLVPVVFGLSVVVGRMVRAKGGAKGGEGPHAKVGLPWFLVAFLILSAIASAGWMPAVLVAPLSWLSRWCLLAAIAGVGMKTDLGRLREVGAGAIVLVVSESLFLAVLSLAVLSWG
jgi:uncharacterized integral membrane protein (TIGR00698 family)